MNRFATLLILATLAAPAAAQPRPTSPPTTDTVSADDYLLTISLHNQRLDAVVKQISQASGANVLLIAPGVPENQLPMIESLELKDVGIRQALAVLTQITSDTSLAPASPGEHNKRQNQRDVYLLTYSPRQPGSAEEQTQGVKVYNLGAFADPANGGSQKRVKDVLSLLDTSLAEIQGKAADVKYHEPTYTLIVRGSDAQQSTVADVLGSQTPPPAGPKPPGFYVRNLDEAQVGELNSNSLYNMQVELEKQLEKVKKLQQLMRPTSQPEHP